MIHVRVIQRLLDSGLPTQPSHEQRRAVCEGDGNVFVPGDGQRCGRRELARRGIEQIRGRHRAALDRAPAARD